MVAGRVWNIAYVSRHIACACGNEVSASPLFSGPRGVAASFLGHGIIWEIVYGGGLP